MPNKASTLIFSLVALILFLAPPDARGEKLDSRYLSMTIPAGTDTYGILMKLGAGNPHNPGAMAETEKPDVNTALCDALDGLYMDVSDVLGIHMYSFRVNLEIVPSRRELNAFLTDRLGRTMDIPSYYFYDANTVWLSFEEMTAGILAHEISHAIITHYFVVPPPENVQEILAGYVEYSITKAGKRAPEK